MSEKEWRPMCKICGKNHFSNEPHAWEKRTKDPVQPGLNKTKKKSKRKKKR